MRLFRFTGLFLLSYALIFPLDAQAGPPRQKAKGTGNYHTISSFEDKSKPGTITLGIAQVIDLHTALTGKLETLRAATQSSNITQIADIVKEYQDALKELTNLKAAVARLTEYSDGQPGSAPTHLNSLHVNTGINASQNDTTYLMGLTLSSYREDHDFSGQYSRSALRQLPSEDGYAVSLRFGLDHANRKVVNDMDSFFPDLSIYTKILEIPSSAQTDGQMLLDVSTINAKVTQLLKLLPDPAYIQPLKESSEKSKMDYIVAQRHLRYSLVLNAAEFTHEGSIAGIGANLSKLAPLKPRSSWPGAVSGALGIEAAWLHAAPGALQHSTMAPRVTLALAWQDQVSFYTGYDQAYVHEHPEATQAQVRRWHLQIGARYNFSNGLDQGDQIELFVSHRDYKRYLEYTVSGGKGPDNKGFIGFKLTQTFRL